MNQIELSMMTHRMTWASRNWRRYCCCNMRTCLWWTIDKLKKMNGILKRRERNDSHIAEWLIYGVYERDTGSNPERRIFFSFSYVQNALNVAKFFFAYDRRYPDEISTATEVFDHADSEYAICFFRELFLQNRSTVICFSYIHPRWDEEFALKKIW